MASILLVDDEAMILRVMRTSLEKVGYKVDTAADGVEALEKIRLGCPDILVTDIEMPRMTGRELCLELQRSIPDRTFPIFVATSLTAIEHREWSSRIPKLVFLEKPISIRKLRSTIAEFLAQDGTVTQ